MVEPVNFPRHHPIARQNLEETKSLHPGEVKVNLSHAIDKNKFDAFLSPFTHLLTRFSNSIVRFFSSTTRVVVIAGSAIFEVFYRLIFNPEFDPDSVYFKKILHHLKDQALQLHRRVLCLHQRFCEDHLILQDLKELKNLISEVKTSHLKLQKYIDLLGDRSLDALDSQLKIYEQLEKQIFDFLDVEHNQILFRTKKIFRIFIEAEAVIPANIQSDLLLIKNNVFAFLDDLLDHYEKLDSQVDSQNQTLKLLLSRKTSKILSKKNALIELFELSLTQSDTFSSNHHSLVLSKPLKLKNIVNSCYMDSALEALLCIDKICNQINQLIPPHDPALPTSDHNPSSEVIKKKLAIQKEILPFIHHQKAGDVSFTNLEFLLFIREAPSQIKLRREIFYSGLHAEFTKETIKRQLDAATMVEFLLDQFLPICQFKCQEHADTRIMGTEKEFFPGFQFLGPADTRKTLQIPLHKGKRKIEELIDLELGLRWSEKEEDPKYQRNFDPSCVKTAVIVDKTKANRELPSKRIDQYRHWYRLSEPPDVMVLHIKRFCPTILPRGEGIAFQKMDDPVEMPKDGFIDMTDHFDLPSTDSPKEKIVYKIRSTVIHQGFYENGHYVAHVEKNRKYYLCDDLNPSLFREIGKEDFFGSTNPYLIVMERV